VYTEKQVVPHLQKVPSIIKQFLAQRDDFVTYKFSKLPNFPW